MYTFTILTPEQTAKWDALCQIERAATQLHYDALYLVAMETIPPEFQRVGEYTMSQKPCAGFSSQDLGYLVWLENAVVSPFAVAANFKFSRKKKVWALKSFMLRTGLPPYGFSLTFKKLEAAINAGRDYMEEAKRGALLAPPSIDSPASGRPV